MNWSTAVATVRERAGKSAAENDRIQRKLCDGTQFLRDELLRWNQAHGTITLTTGFGSYASASSTGVAAGLPADVVRILSDTINVDVAGSNANRLPLSWVPRETIEAYRRNMAQNAVPAMWSFWDERLEVWPPSDTSTHVVSFDYLQDLGTLTYRLVATVWKFYRPDGTTELTPTDTYTNAWLTQGQGFNLLTSWAEWKLWQAEWKGDSGQAERAAQAFTEALGEASKATMLQNLPRGVRPWTPDYPGRYPTGLRYWRPDTL